MSARNRSIKKRYHPKKSERLTDEDEEAEARARGRKPEIFTGRKQASGRTLCAGQKVLDEKVELYDSLSQKLASLMQQADQHKNEVFEHSGDRSSAEAEISSLQPSSKTLERRKAALLSDKDSGEDSNKETLDN